MEPLEGTQTYTFQAEVNRLMNIMIHSVYSKKDVFLREIISNASDALSKARLREMTRTAKGNTTLAIRIAIDRTNHILQVEDNGVGMTRAELVQNLGTVAKSGTLEYLNRTQQVGPQNLANTASEFEMKKYQCPCSCNGTTATRHKQYAGF